MMKTGLTSIALTLALLGCQKGDEHRGHRAARAAEPAPATSPAAPAPAPADRPAALGAEEMATIDAMARFTTGLRQAVEQNKGDCDRLAAALAPVIERGKPVIERARALEQKLESDEAAREWIQAYVEKKTGGFEGIAKGVDSCASHPGVQKALAGFLQ